MYHVLVMEHCAWLAAWAARRTSPALALPIGIATFLVSNALVFLNSRWSFRYFEEPILRLKTRFKTSDSELPIPGEYGDISRAAASRARPTGARSKAGAVGQVAGLGTRPIHSRV